jgi:group I intron endonuclease
MINTSNNIPLIGIYKITSPTGKIYIGQSKNILQRFKFYSFYNCKNQTKLYNSFKKHKVENHFFEIIEECSVKHLNEREEYWINHLNSIKKGLNIQNGGNASPRNIETKKKISRSLTGKTKSPSHRSNISSSRKGMRFTEQHKHNMSKSRFRYSIICLENGKIYKSANQASKDLNIYPSSIIKVCEGKYKQTKGYTFKFI